jgi:hypothetical protein
VRRAVPALALVVVVAPGCQLLFEPDPGDRGPGSQSVELTFESPITIGDLPLPIRITPDDLDVSAVGDAKTDLRFVGADGEDRPFEVERWSPDGESVVWVLPALFDEGLTLYYGEDAGGVASATDVWSQSWAAVWHLSDGGAADTVLDSTGAHPGTGEEATFEPGQIGLGRTFGIAGSEPVTFLGGEALFGGWTQLTIEAHIRPVTGTWIEKGDSIDDARAYAGKTGGMLDLDVNLVECDCWADSHIEVDLGEWTHVAYTYDGETVIWFRDGDHVGEDSPLYGGPVNVNSDPLVMGDGEDGLFEGALDEVRISRVHRSPDFVFAAYATAAPTFVSIVR